MSHALGALCVRGDTRLDVRLQRQKTRLCGALNTRPGNSGFQREDGPGAQAGDGMDAGISSLRGLAVQTLRGHEETVWKFAQRMQYVWVTQPSPAVWGLAIWHKQTGSPRGQRKLHRRGVGRLEIWA